MNTKDFLRLGVPLGEAPERATDFVSRFILAAIAQHFDLRRGGHDVPAFPAPR
ncbi:MAG TPA: hypothetical protein VN887_18035 [Candidatus Angelobacter sp.]|nr:hypothetical protein [Candidatus Angelobacter sp.]